tara:strand:+ start:403 stop:720 length:318 start_codon:yes stop_codon:yes gene_type:complete
MPRIISKRLGKNVLGQANKGNTILISKSIDKNSAQAKRVIAHEKVHLEQMRRGDLDYDDKNFYWKGKTYPRNKIDEGSENLPWEKEAYRASRRKRVSGKRRRRRT